MTSLDVACLNVRGLGSVRRQACLLDYLRAHSIDVMVTTETRLDSTHTFSHLLGDYKKVMFPCRAGGGGDVVVL